MSGALLGGAVFASMLGLMALRVPIAMAMFFCGAAGYVLLAGPQPLLQYLNHSVYARFSLYDLSVVPLFLLMGYFASSGGLSAALFGAARAFIGHWRGGLAMAAVAACAAFGAICGSSLATAATMAQVALPELRRNGYEPGFATGALAAGGTLGILIPPSVVLVIYAMLAEQNIARLFMAAFVPGILAAIGYLVVIAVYVRLVPGAGPAGERGSAGDRLRAVAAVWPVLLVFLAMLGGIYGGVFTPTEAAALGAAGTGLLAWRGGMGMQGLLGCLRQTAHGTAMIFMIVAGADVLNSFLALSQVPADFAAWIGASGLPPLVVLGCMIAIYVVLGCVMDSFSMILLTVPLFLPIVLALDFWGLSAGDKAIWFGILALMVVEIGLVTPPVGMNVFILHSVARDVPMQHTFRGVLPFLASDLLRVLLLVLFPSLALALVQWLG
ncbi:MAG TPA: TRAP transporter large permease [Ramlibacter sp.]|nr:TRAP transporter large permease [Ramlibacter sp.]